MESIIKPKSTAVEGWQLKGRAPEQCTLGYEGYYWLHRSRGLAVISSVEVPYDQNDIDKGPEYHLSISKNGRRCSSNEARMATRCFDMEHAEEDNHVPYGFVRHFWLPVAEKFIGYECRCKAVEPAIKEDKGDFIWRPKGL